MSQHPFEAKTHSSYQEHFASAYETQALKSEYIAELVVNLHDNNRLADMMLALLNTAYLASEQTTSQKQLHHTLSAHIGYFTDLARPPLGAMTFALKYDSPKMMHSQSYILPMALKDTVRHSANQYTAIALLLAIIVLSALMMTAASFAFAYGMVSVPFKVGMVYLNAVSQNTLIAVGAVSAVSAVGSLVAMGLFAHAARTTRGLISDPGCFTQIAPKA